MCLGLHPDLRLQKTSSKGSTTKIWAQKWDRSRNPWDVLIFESYQPKNGSQFRSRFWPHFFTFWNALHCFEAGPPQVGLNLGSHNPPPPPPWGEGEQQQQPWGQGSGLGLTRVPGLNLASKPWCSTRVRTWLPGLDSTPNLNSRRRDNTDKLGSTQVQTQVQLRSNPGSS